MSEKAPSQKVSATEFKSRQGSWLQKVVEGTRLALTRHGIVVVSIEPAQGVLPLGDKTTPENLKSRLMESLVLIGDLKILENLVGIAKCLGNKSAMVKVTTRSVPRGGDIRKDVLAVSEKLDPKDLEKLVNIVQIYVGGRWGKSQR